MMVEAWEIGAMRRRDRVPRSRSSIIERAIRITMKNTNITVYDGTMIW